MCLVGSQTLFALAHPMLYRKIHLLVKDDMQSKVMAMLTRENPGLHHIREVRLSACFHEDQCSAGYQWLEVFINMVPKDILERFSWDTPRALPTRITYLLWRRQTKLQHIELFAEYHPQDDTPDQEEPNLLAYLNHHDMSSVTEVRIVPDCIAAALTCCAALKGRAIRTLIVDARRWTVGDDYQDEITGDIVDPLTSHLFSHIKSTPALFGPLSSLTDLRLSDVDFRYAKQTWFQYLDLAKLKHLKLEYCKNMDYFLSELSHSAHPPWLESLVLVYELNTNDDRTIENLEDLLMYPKKTLSKLHLCLRNAHQMPRVNALRCHAATLKELSLDITSRSSTALYYDDSELANLLDVCDAAKLKRLGLHLPPADFEYLDFGYCSMSFKESLVCGRACTLVLRFTDSHYRTSSSSTHATLSRSPSSTGRDHT